MQDMRALVKSGREFGLLRIPVPRPGVAEVRVRVQRAGLCRTDVQIALGKLPSADPLVLGHEFAGVIDALGAQVSSVRPGQRVAVLPVLGCGTCAICVADDAINCPNRTMLGVDRDGAFAEYVCVPAAAVFPVPSHLDLQVAAYAEPVSAALAVLHGGVQPDQKGLILGRNRFAWLVERLLRLHGFHHLVNEELIGSAIAVPDDSFDFAVETTLNDACLREMIRVVRPRGILLLKSRLPGDIALPVLPLLRKQLTLRGLNYGSFRTAIRLLAEGQLNVSDLLGPVEPLEAFSSVVAASMGDETVKIFFDPSLSNVRYRR